MLRTDGLDVYTVSLIKNGERYLLLQRAPAKRFAPNRWTGLGGKVEAGEFSALRASALREVGEEAGIAEAEIAYFVLRRVLLVSRPRQVLSLLLYFTGQWQSDAVPACPEGRLHWKRFEEFAVLDIIETTCPVLDCLVADMSRDPSGKELPRTGLGLFTKDGQFQCVTWG